MNALRAGMFALLLQTALVWSGASLAQGTVAEPVAAPDFIYRTQPGDTLIGFARRALIEPQRWRDLQQLNGIANARRIPIGTPLRVPVAWLRQTAVDVEVIDVIGEVAIGGRPVRVGDRLAEGTALDTGQNGFLSLRTAEGAIVVVQSGTRVTLQRLRRYDGAGGHDTRIDLEAGRAESEVPKGNAGRFEIVTPVAVGAVRGTEFRVAFDAADRSARSEVVTGVVAVAGSGAAPGADTELPAGFGARTDAAGRTSPPVKLLPAPVLKTPTTRFEVATASFEIEPIPLAASYRVQVATDAAGRLVVAEQSAATTRIEIAALDDGDYWLRLRAVDANGLQGADTTQRFEVRARPLPPQLDQPVAGGKLSAAAATFRWQASAADSLHRLQLARDSDFSAVVADRDQLAGSETALTGLAPGGYFWRVAALRPDGSAGPWSAARAVTVKAVSAQPEPVTFAGKSAVVSWSAEAGQAHQLQVARAATFEKPLRDEQVAELTWQFEPPGPGEYFVRVRATDPDGYVGPWSEARSFEVPAPRWLRWMSVVSFLPLLL
ncbi:MAG TPA: FecR domain-containing protein [Steroidobacteraceae bacterium]|nr:FecR domain-containing protein [Steroidobacteraceae bacterium]HRX89336.1 FecR domain-containing protein [Steroidobacteraceae bacterium]